MNSATTARKTRRTDGRNPNASSVADDILARASAVVERLAAEYPAHALRDIRRLARLADRMSAENDARAGHYEEIFRIIHDIRGQGTLFGYPLITRCADSLCLAVRRLKPDDGAVIGLVRTHAAALSAIMRHRPGDDHNPSALFVAAGLELLVLMQTRHSDISGYRITR